jgi:hypothetical protein
MYEGFASHIRAVTEGFDSTLAGAWSHYLGIFDGTCTYHALDNLA